MCCLADYWSLNVGRCGSAWTRDLFGTDGYPAGQAGDFEENRILRHILPPQADWLELDRCTAGVEPS